MKWSFVNLANVLGSAEVFVDGDWVESKDQDVNGDVRLIQLADIGDGCYIDKSSRFLTSDKARELRCTFIEKGDVLVARMPEPLGRACIFPGDSKRTVTVVDVCIIRLKPENHNARWLMHCLNAPICRNQMADFATGTTRTRISRGNLAKIKIPLPPLAEQKRIAEILDCAEELRSKRREAIAQLDTLTQAIFLEMFGDPVTNLKEWDWNTLGNICAEIYRYPTFYGFEYQETGTPVARIGNILLDGRLDPDISNYVFIDPAISKQFPRTILELQDIVMAVRGDGSTAKRIGFVTSDSLVSANISPNLLRFKAKAKVSHPLFLFNFMVSDIGQRVLESYVTRTAKKTITAEGIKKIKVPLPPFSLQEEFAHRVEAVEKLKAAHRASLSELDALFASLQHRAFRGEL